MSFTGQLTDVSQVDKFELSDAEYAKRNGGFICGLYLRSRIHPIVLDTVLVYKQRNKVGRFAVKDEQQQPARPPPQITIEIGSRCEVESSEPGLSKRGTVRFVGLTNFGNKEGLWVGVEYDEPMGKNDGS